MVEMKTVSSAIQQMPMATTDTNRVIAAMVAHGGTLQLGGQSWQHFGSQPLITAEVVIVKDGCLEIGPKFEEYLIGQGMAETHQMYRRLILSLPDDKENVPTSPDELSEYLRDVVGVEARISRITKAIEALSAGMVDIQRSYGLVEQALDEYIKQGESCGE